MGVRVEESVPKAIPGKAKLPRRWWLEWTEGLPPWWRKQCVQDTVQQGQLEYVPGKVRKTPLRTRPRRMDLLGA